MNISDTFKQIRNTYNKTQQEFADSIGVSRSTISQIEGDRANPTIEILQKVIDTYNINSNVFFNKNNIESSKPDSNTNGDNLIDYDYVLNYLRQSIVHFDKLHQSLIDVKMMSISEGFNDLAQNTFTLMDDLADIKILYFSDLSFTENSLNPYKVKSPVNIKGLNNTELKEYLIRISSHKQLFESIFFNSFNEFYKLYSNNHMIFDK